MYLITYNRYTRSSPRNRVLSEIASDPVNWLMEKLDNDPIGGTEYHILNVLELEEGDATFISNSMNEHNHRWNRTQHQIHNHNP